ncbi:MAG: hypothetical protein HY378_01325 [Candidatus Brennerbacteria bacterium]|nr:hypothetical protein [Candidatus Brennerbacteria bacterium]
MIWLFFSLAVLIGAFVFQVATYRTDKSNWAYKTYRNIFLFAALAVFLFYLYLVFAQYLAWRGGGELTKFLVPPYRSILYVFGYHFTRFGLYYLVSLAAAAFFLFSSIRLNRRFGDRFFEPEEPYLGALSVFLLGNPIWNYAWIYYLAAVILVAVIATGYQLLVTKENRRFSLYYLWLPLAIAVILIKSFA